MGNAIINAIAMASRPRKGRVARKTSRMVVSGGAAAFATKRVKPKGGDVADISILRSVNAPNQTGLNPRACTTGMYIGIEIISSGVADIGPPRIIRRTIIAMMLTIGATGRPVASSIKPGLPPEKARISLKATDPQTITNSITYI